MFSPVARAHNAGHAHFQVFAEFDLNNSGTVETNELLALGQAPGIGADEGCPAEKPQSARVLRCALSVRCLEKGLG